MFVLLPSDFFSQIVRLRRVKLDSHSECIRWTDWKESKVLSMKLRLNFNCKTKNNSLDICLNHLFGIAQSIQVEFVSM